MNPIIKVENVSKQYRLGGVGTGTVKDDLKRWWYRARGKEDPFLTIGDTNDRTTQGESDYVWALKDINFEVQPGEVLGIIGRNGAGKSTLLKILSRVTEPTTGRITMNGRVASLLEVGTGMHPDLTGRENIYLNGAILGMTKAEINRKLDEIIDFSGVERYIDTPVKRYSSGMHVRLGFAVAAHLEPEILIVDEVLAVGDAEFQKKCLGKMKDVSEREGRTVLFVSHNMQAIQKLCSSVLVLHQGEVFAAKQNTKDAMTNYLQGKSQINKYTFQKPTKNKAQILEAWCENGEGEPSNEWTIGINWSIKLRIEVFEPVADFIIGVGITDINETPINTNWQKPIQAEPGIFIAEFLQRELVFAAGKYLINLGLTSGKNNIEYIESALGFDIVEVTNNIDETVQAVNKTAGIILNQMCTSLKNENTGITIY